MVWKFSLPFRKTDDGGTRSTEKQRPENGGKSKMANKLFKRSRRNLNPIQIDVEYHEEKTHNDTNEMLDEDEGECQSPTALSSCGFQSRSGSFDFTDQDSGVILRSSCGDFGQHDKGLYSEVFVELPKLPGSGAIDIVIGGGSDQALKIPIVQRIIPSSHTAKTKSINIGDQIVSINGQNVEKLKLNKINQLIKTSKSPVKFIFHRQLGDNVDGNIFITETQVLQKDFEEVSISPGRADVLDISTSDSIPTPELPSSDMTDVVVKTQRSTSFSGIIARTAVSPCHATASNATSVQRSTVSATMDRRRPKDRSHKAFTRNDPIRHSLRSYNPVLSTFGQTISSPSSPSSPASACTFFATGDEESYGVERPDNCRTPSCSTSSENASTITIFRSRSCSAPMSRQASAIYQDDVLQLSPNSREKTAAHAPSSRDVDRDSTHLVDDVDLWPAHLGSKTSRGLFKSKSFSTRSPEQKPRAVLGERSVSRSDATTDGNTGGKQIMHSRSAYDRLRSSFRKRRGKRTLNGGVSNTNGNHDVVTLKAVSNSSLNTLQVKHVRTTDDNRRVYKFMYDGLLDLGLSIGGGIMSTYGDCAPFVQGIRPGSLADGALNIGDVFIEINGTSSKRMTSSEVTALLRDCANRKVYIVVESEAQSVRTPKSQRSV